MTSKSHSPFTRYRGKWVALAEGTDDAVIAAGDTLAEARQKAAAKGHHDVVLHLVPANDAYFVGVSDH